MAKPYVYRCEHKTTGRFYIGYRKANILPAIEDFGIHYFTSCPEISNNFRDYSYEILSEYDSNLMAFEVEQRLIYEFRHNDLLINKNFKVRNLIQLDPKPVIQTASLKKRRTGSSTSRCFKIKAFQQLEKARKTAKRAENRRKRKQFEKDFSLSSK